MAIRCVRLGTPRARREGPRLGTVRHPPRGVPKDDLARRDYYDIWLPELAPSARLLSWARARPMTDRRWAAFAARFKSEMRAAPAARLLTLLAALSSRTDFAIGCYCADEARCHRAILKAVLLERGADVR
jgi:uncharacterized protein YeaO (DUF488 family)